MIREYNFMDLVTKPFALDCHPSMKECHEAYGVACQVIQYYVERAQLPESDPAFLSSEALMKIIAAEVWRAGRVFQRNKDAKALAI